jgi:hypothetical protein
MESAMDIDFNIRGPMISASADAEVRRYHLVREPNGREWVYADQENAADNIYADGGQGSRGMGGRTLTFTLVNGETVNFIGPWKGNADSLFEKTGVDLREKYQTTGVVARYRDLAVWPKADTYRDVLHYDGDEWVVGEFNRIEKIAQVEANKLQERVYFAFRAHGGGHSGFCDPK